jgi:hypothetical protein
MRAIQVRVFPVPVALRIWCGVPARLQATVKFKVQGYQVQGSRFKVQGSKLVVSWYLFSPLKLALLR